MNVNLNAAEEPAPIWEQCLSVFLHSKSKETRDFKWLSSIKCLSVENDIISLEAPSEFAKEWFLGRFYDSFLKIAQNINPNINRISIFAPQIKESRAVVQAPELKKPEKLKHGNFCKKYKLSNFIAETSNESVLESAKFIAAMPRTHENFLIISGGAGLGKTHLLHAIGREALANWADKAVLWDSDRFFKEKRKGNLASLYQTDILLFDNLQNIYNSSEVSQNELLTILKHLKSKGKSIVVSVNPKHKNHPIPEFSDFLKMGIKCELKKPDLRTRISILRQKALEKELPIELLENSWKLIAEKFGESVCSLEGEINKLAAMRDLLKCEITPQIILSAYDEKHKKGSDPSMKSIAAAAALAYGISVESLCGKSRMARVNKPRKIAIYLCKQIGFSLSEIGKFFNRDTSSVSNAIQSVKKELTGKDGYSFEFEVKDILNAAKVSGNH